MRAKNSQFILSGLAALSALSPAALATVLTFTTDNAKVPVYTSMNDIQAYGSNAAGGSLASGPYTYFYDVGNGWTPDVTVHYSTQSPTDYPLYYGNSDGDTVWPGVCFLWSYKFDGGQQQPLGTKMPIGYEYYFTFTPSVANKGVVLNSFVLNDYIGYYAPSAPDQEVQWRVAKGHPSGSIVASGSATTHDGEVITISTGMTAGQADGQPLVLVIKRLAGTEDDLAVDNINFDEVGLATASYNTGSLGAAGNGANTADLVLDQPGVVAAGGDHATYYAAGARTTIPWQASLNPPAGSPFTIEFWAKPAASDNDDAPVFNRVTTGNRSGWVFFQRAPATGWNLRMYNGAGSAMAWDLTGGTSILNQWSHVVAVWNGSSAKLYVNGTLADESNDPGASGAYNASTAATFCVGSYDTGGSPITGLVDEVAFYHSVLTSAQILGHYNTASSSIPGAYSSLVKGDGAVLYLQQNPPSVGIGLVDRKPTVTFTGVLSQSADLRTWQDLSVTSPYSVLADPQPEKLFFRAHR